MRGGASPEMIAAGTAVALEQLSAESFAARGIDPPRFVQALYQAMAASAWRPIASAPRDGTDLLLGVFQPSGFVSGIGRWMAGEDEMNAGSWSTEGWWGQPPTHWMPMPAPPALKATV